MYVKCIDKEDYDFSYFVVSKCLQHLANSIHEEQYICTSCNKALKQTSDENPPGCTISCKVCKCSHREQTF